MSRSPLLSDAPVSVAAVTMTGVLERFVTRDDADAGEPRPTAYRPIDAHILGFWDAQPLDMLRCRRSTLLLVWGRPTCPPGQP